MKRAERDRIMKQGVVAPETPRQRLDREALLEEMRTPGVSGRRLRLRLRNFRPTEDSYLSALGGPLPYMVRLRTITEMTVDHERRLAEAWEALVAEIADDDRFAEAWEAEVARWSFDEVNDLIDRHNRYYPVESRLPMDPKTKDYALVGGEDYRRRPLDAAWALERFPASRERARLSA
jgi:hypothetical protein